MSLADSPGTAVGVFRVGRAGVAFAAISLAMAAFWKFRIVDPAQDPSLLLSTIDLYTEHLPMARFGFAALSSGSLPLWNPYQLCGLPMLAVSHTGLLYPGNAPYWWLDAAVATEFVYVVHLILAAAGLWGLARSFGIGWAGCASGAVAYAWSGYLAIHAHQSAILSGLAWLPATLLAIEWALRGKRWGLAAIAVAVALQILNGATEVLVYTLYAGALFVLVRSVQFAASSTAALALRRAAGVLAGVVVGVALSMVQLLPSLELVSQGARASQPLGLAEQLAPYGPIPFGLQLLYALQQPAGVVGACSMLLGASLRRQRSLWVFAVVVSILSLLLASGGPLYQLYAQTPVGTLFRYPAKFHQLSAFGLALLVATGVHALASRCGERRHALWADWWWRANAAVAVLVLGVVVLLGKSAADYLLVVAALALFGAMPWKPARVAIVSLLVIGLGSALFRDASNDRIRPAGRPGLYESNTALFDWLRERTGDSRVYLSPRLRLFPGVTLKQGMLQRVPTVGDYESLASLRQADYFAAASGEALARKLVISHEPAHDQASPAFAGYLLLGKGSAWKLMEMASTRFFVTLNDDEVAQALARRARVGRGGGVHRVMAPGRQLADAPGRWAQLWEMSSYLPRAYFVSRAIVVAGPEQALDEILSPDFDPRAAVVLEVEGAPAAPAAGNQAELRPASIRDSAPERVEVAIETDQPGFLVLTDSWFSGWQASVDGKPAPIHRANHLFRAVPVAAGASTVVFEYRPSSVRIGAWISGVTVALLAVAGLLGARVARRRPQTTAALP